MPNRSKMPAKPCESTPVFLDKTLERIRIPRAQHAQNMVRTAKATDGMDVICNAPDSGQAQQGAIIKAEASVCQEARKCRCKARGQNLNRLWRLRRGKLLKAGAGGKAPHRCQQKFHRAFRLAGGGNFQSGEGAFGHGLLKGRRVSKPYGR